MIFHSFRLAIAYVSVIICCFIKFVVIWIDGYRFVF